MTAAESANQTVAVVIDGHTPSGSEGNILCWCDERFNFWAEHAKHVAAAVVEALGLKQETNHYEKFETTADMGGEGAMAYGGQTQQSVGWRTSTRLVSEWVEGEAP